MKYWIVVVSKDHLTRGIAGHFIQANHGKAAPLKRMSAGDWVICYSPKQCYPDGEPLQAFTAMGEVGDDAVYQYQMSDDFIPYRRNINYHDSHEVPIAPMISDLDFIENKQSWGYRFRFGFFEILEHDFKLIRAAMVK